jgi:DNA-binding response OmpR family regulator
MHDKKILVIDDDAALERVLTARLSQEFTVFSAHDGPEGIAAALAHHPDLVLLDISLPRLDGTAVLKEIRTGLGDWGQQVPVILLTNLAADEKIMQSVAVDTPSFYLIKADYSLEGIVDKVKEALGISKPGSVSI